jgi:hypothetical protein
MTETECFYCCAEGTESLNTVRVNQSLREADYKEGDSKKVRTCFPRLHKFGAVYLAMLFYRLKPMRV